VANCQIQFELMYPFTRLSLQAKLLLCALSVSAYKGYVLNTDGT